MEFTCQIDFEAYREGLRLKGKNKRRLIYGVLFCDGLLWIYWMIEAAKGEISTGSAILRQAIIFLAYPVLCLVIYEVWAFLSYQKNRNIKREITYQITPQTVSYTSASGSLGSSPWTSVDYWRESKRLVIVAFPSNAFLIFPRENMSTRQWEDFRGILSSALPKK